MAIARRNTIAAIGTGTSSVTVTPPTGYTAGDCLLAFIVDHSTTNAQSTAPTGWTPRGYAWASGTRFQVFSAIVGSGGLTGSTWSFTGLTSRSAGICIAYSGVDGSNPIDVTSSVRVNASGTMGTLGITPVTANCMIVAGYCAFASGSTWSGESVATNPTLTEWADSPYSTYCSIATADGLQTTATATGASTATMGTAGANAGILLALRPSSGPPRFDPECLAFHAFRGFI